MYSVNYVVVLLLVARISSSISQVWGRKMGHSLSGIVEDGQKRSRGYYEDTTAPDYTTFFPDEVRVDDGDTDYINNSPPQNNEVLEPVPPTEGGFGLKLGVSSTYPPPTTTLAPAATSRGPLLLSPIGFMHFQPSPMPALVRVVPSYRPNSYAGSPQTTRTISDNSPMARAARVLKVAEDSSRSIFLASHPDDNNQVASNKQETRTEDDNEVQESDDVGDDAEEDDEDDEEESLDDNYKVEARPQTTAGVILAHPPVLAMQQHNRGPPHGYGYSVMIGPSPMALRARGGATPASVSTDNVPKPSQGKQKAQSYHYQSGQIGTPKKRRQEPHNGIVASRGPSQLPMQLPVHLVPISAVFSVSPTGQQSHQGQSFNQVMIPVSVQPSQHRQHNSVRNPQPAATSAVGAPSSGQGQVLQAQLAQQLAPQQPLVYSQQPLVYPQRPIPRPHHAARQNVLSINPYTRYRSAMAPRPQRPMMAHAGGHASIGAGAEHLYLPQHHPIPAASSQSSTSLFNPLRSLFSFLGFRPRNNYYPQQLHSLSVAGSQNAAAIAPSPVSPQNMMVPYSMNPAQQHMQLPPFNPMVSTAKNGAITQAQLQQLQQSMMVSQRTRPLNSPFTIAEIKGAPPAPIASHRLRHPSAMLNLITTDDWKPIFPTHKVVTPPAWAFTPVTSPAPTPAPPSIPDSAPESSDYRPMTMQWVLPPPHLVVAKSSNGSYNMDPALASTTTTKTNAKVQWSRQHYPPNEVSTPSTTSFSSPKPIPPPRTRNPSEQPRMNNQIGVSPDLVVGTPGSTFLRIPETSSEMPPGFLEESLPSPPSYQEPTSTAFPELSKLNPVETSTNKQQSFRPSPQLFSEGTEYPTLATTTTASTTSTNNPSNVQPKRYSGPLRSYFQRTPDITQQAQQEGNNVQETSTEAFQNFLDRNVPEPVNIPEQSAPSPSSQPEPEQSTETTEPLPTPQALKSSPRLPSVYTLPDTSPAMARGNPDVTLRGAKAVGESLDLEPAFRVEDLWKFTPDAPKLQAPVFVPSPSPTIRRFLKVGT